MDPGLISGSWRFPGEGNDYPLQCPCLENSMDTGAWWAMVFPVVTYGCENWTIKKAECRRIDASELWCWRRLLRVPWPARRSNQSILKEISPEYSLEGLMLKLQYFGYLMWRVNSSEKTLMLGKTEGRRRRRWQRMTMHNTQQNLNYGITFKGMILFIFY